MPIKAIVLDIEGTTSSISFVKDTLFPYAEQNVHEYLKEKWADADVQEVMKELRLQYEIDATNNVEGLMAISDGEGKDQTEQIDEIVANVKWLIKNDRKTTSLKKLQGLIWEKGYGDGSIKGHVYDDVPKAFERWTNDNIKIYIYSSGSEAAQKLLFENSEQGDLTSKITGYFDTNIGAKQEKGSYQKIVQEIGCDASEILFLTDIVNEAHAAKESGIHVAVLDRPGNTPLTDDDKSKYQVLTAFDDITLEFISAKRKLDEIVTDETNAKFAKLDADEAAVLSNITESETVPDSNGTDMTDNINSKDMKEETHVSKQNRTDIAMNIDETEQNDIPIMKTECDLSNKIVNLDVEVDVVAEDKNNGEKIQTDSKPCIMDEVKKENGGDNIPPVEVVDEKYIEMQTAEDIEMRDVSVDTKANLSKSDDEDGSLKVAVDAAESDNLKESVVVTPEVIAVDPKTKTESSDKVQPELIFVKEIIENTTDVIDSKQNGNHTNIDIQNTKIGVDMEMEIIEKIHSDDQVATVKNDETTCNEPQVATMENIEKKNTEDPAVIVENNIKKHCEDPEATVDNDDKSFSEEPLTVEKNEKICSEGQMAIENGAKDNDINNKENIPIDVVKEKENIIEIPIHIDADTQSNQKPSIISTPATNSNGISSVIKKDDLDTETMTNSSKEKVSRIELIIEEKDNDNGQMTQTTTHIVKEITIVKKSVCESVDTAEKPTEIV